ncbi:MAG: roadblock/LC7 domain-containing protein [Candidatus Eremiobacterota bacterium]
MSELAKVLENFCRLDGVQGALVVDSNGSVLGDFAPGMTNLGSVVEVVTRSLAMGRQVADDLGKSPVNHQYLEFSQMQITSEVLNHQRVLVVCAKAGANLGRIRLEIKKTKPDVEKLLT